MAVELATAYVSLTASAKGIGRSIQSELEGPLARSGAKAGEETAKNFGTKLKSGIGGLGSLGVDKLFATAAIGAGVKFAVSAASDLQESLSKTDAVFRENADSVKDWADTAASSFGQSKQQALEAAGTFGNLFQAFGVGLQPATEMSTTLTELASDLASFNNTSVQEAIEALRSGLSGETEPLKRYGVALTDARLKQEALGLGLINDVKAPLDAAAKSQAAYSLIMKDTALAQGDFARTADGFANSMRTLQANIQNVAADLGSLLLPGLAKLAGFASKAIQIVVEVKEKTGGDNSPFFQDLPGFVGKLFEGMATGKPPWELWEPSIKGTETAIANSMARIKASLQGVLLPEQFQAGIVNIGGWGRALQQAAVTTMQATMSADAYARSVTNEAEALHAANDALQQHLNAQLAAIDSGFAVTNAQNQFTAAVEAARVATDDLSTGVNEQQVAYDQATQAAIATAAATVEYAKQQAEAEGKTVSAKREQELLIGTLMQLASQASGPVAAAIGVVITQLQTVGQQKPKPTVDANTEPATTKTKTARDALDAFGRTTATGTLDVDTSRANRALQNVYDKIRNLPLLNIGNFGLASGVRNWRGGWTWVGEQGPELVNLPRGADVFSAAESRGMVGSGSGSALHPAETLVITGNTFIGTGPEVVKLLNQKLAEARQAAVRLAV